MAFSEKPLSIFARILALVALIHGLVAIFYHFGVTRDLNAPVEALGNIAFAITILSALLRLLAAVGLWSLTAWGGVLLIVANVVELGAAIWVPEILNFSPQDFGLRALVLLAIAALLFWANWTHHNRRNYL
ncbi:hypothetical protein [Maritalea mediterranea]|uniref:Uncharacterized protein n=1 Tax=Maritalea mediterranea TaxID=2909667 RepID=A0ABS9E8U3_9HYPH|nr:hypothetical protein [Maritalea mediterranea]MCF4098175.1 hypothetical protein [Maritalea mediterranea]